MLSLEELESATLDVTNIDDLDVDVLNEILNKHDYGIVKGLINPDEIKHAKNLLFEQFLVENDSPATGESPNRIQDNFQKLSIGGGELREKDLSKCVRTFYNPIFAKDIYGLRNAFRQAAMVRNLVTGFRKDFALDTVQDGFWTASRIHHYPTGGGHMEGHIDDYVPVIVGQYGVNSYFQPLIVMSKKGEGEDCDYKKGGGYFENNGGRIYYDAFLELGSIIIYNTKIFHGVEEIDPHLPFRQSCLNGRFSGLVTMYRDLS
ncbi:hypothetical protein GCM10007160_37640 [Litchfieldella qijiaojingensis]|uniref:Fe2OG dioxygenase domain-containing protein n=1 Tax=Litchfieldella qijiaojingensis TaxID=980347 RepID=A0ABQ2ZAR1_9GAMM|nr:hypothetical protein [Halomonas qijiaojingensis]GGY06550.1 hypothetical protein GCM10007160_37640 [Halomonas qijiaojingensis]